MENENQNVEALNNEEEKEVVVEANETNDSEQNVSESVGEDVKESTEESVEDDKTADAPTSDENEDDTETDSSSVDTTLSEEPSPEISEEEKSEDDQKENDTPSPDEEKVESSDEADKNETEEVVEEEQKQPDVNEELEKYRREVEELKEAEATRKLIEDVNKQAVQCENQIAEFDDKLQKALVDTFKQYDIDLNTTMEELKNTDPAKFAIAQELIGHAEHIRANQIAQIQAPLVEAQKNVVFREASKIMCNYDMTDEEAQVAASTLINIFNNSGLNDLDNDLKAKVELAVAHAKFTAPKQEGEKGEEVKQEEVSEKEQASEVAAEAVEAPKEEVKEAVEEKPSEAPTEAPTEAPEPKTDLNAFKESAAVSDAIVNNREGVTVDNVIQRLASLPYKERPSFYKEYADLIKQAGILQLKRQGLR